MLHYFPPRFLDETLHSVLSRLHRLSGNRYARHSLEDVFGTHLVVATNSLPSHLEDLQIRLPHPVDRFVDELIEETTLLPYFRPFLSLRQTNLCYEAMMGRSAGAAKVGIGVMASGVSGRNNFRFCMQCRKEDEASLGCAYWHRSHCLPGVQICHLHHIPLHILPHTYVETNRQKLFLPDEIRIDQCLPQQLISSWRENLLLAKSSHALLFSGLPPISRTLLQDFYRNRARNLQLVDKNGRLSISSILSTTAIFRSAFLDNDDLVFIASDGWPLQLLRKHRASLHPVKHLLLMQMLDTSISELNAATHVPPLRRSTPSKLLSTSRPKSLLEKAPRRERFRATLLTSVPARKAPDYMWLYRHDRKWLKETLATHNKRSSEKALRLDWASRDILLAMQVRNIFQNLIQNDESPRLSATYLARQTGKGATIEKFATKLPLTTAALKEISESICAFQSRRVKRVVMQASQADLPLARWQILKLAGLKEPLFMEVEGAITMYLKQARDR